LDFLANWNYDYSFFTSYPDGKVDYMLTNLYKLDKYCDRLNQVCADPFKCHINFDVYAQCETVMTDEAYSKWQEEYIIIIYEVGN